MCREQYYNVIPITFREFFYFIWDSWTYCFNQQRMCSPSINHAHFQIFWKLSAERNTYFSMVQIKRQNYNLYCFYLFWKCEYIALKLDPLVAQLYWGYWENSTILFAPSLKVYICNKWVHTSNTKIQTFLLVPKHFLSMDRHI